MTTPTDPHAGHVTVHASAGTGKTYLLVSRIVRLLLQGARPAAILAITFTHKAAAEMQTRLLDRLLELVDADDVSVDTMLTRLGLTPTPTLRQQARDLYEQLLRSEQPVQTTTFHAFCQQILRRFPLEADVPPGFQLLDRTGLLREEAWDALAMEASRTRAGDTALALDQLFQDLGLFNTRQALNSFLQHRADWWAYTTGEATPVSFASQRLSAALQAHFTEFDPAATPHDLIAHFLQAESTRAHLTGFIPLLLKNPNKKNQAYADGISAALDTHTPMQERWRILVHTVITSNGGCRKPITKKTMRAEDIDAVNQAAETLFADLQQVQDRLAALHNLARTRAWLTAGERFLFHFQRLKAEQRLLDFTDLEWKTFQLLNHGDNALWVQYKLDARIDHLLIDEFQDTNPTQWQLILPLLQELAAGENERQRSVFLVGDAKQSIYRFRRAEPRLFATASNWLESHLDAARFPLNKSWRSSPAITEFVNRLFSTPPFVERLVEFAPHATHKTALPGRVSLLPLIQPITADSDTRTEYRNPLQTPRALPLGNSRLEEGSYIANLIRDLMAQPLLVGESDEARPLCYGDIFILLRQRTHVADFEEALRRAQIPYVGADRGTLLECLEIRDMVELLQWLITPYDDLALAGILRSPLFAIDDTQLQQLAAQANGNWFEGLNAMAQHAPDSVFYRAYHQLHDWQRLAGHIPVHDLLDRIYSDGNILDRYAAAVPPYLSGRVVANLNRFLELALDTDAGRYPSLMAFLESLRELRERPLEAPDEPPATGFDDRVQILTVHAAKGLEAPVVFLADSACAPQDRSAHATLVDWPVTDTRPQLFLLSGRAQTRDSFTQCKLDQQRQAEQREETNLLYVAVTRAKQLLYLSGTRPSRQYEQSWYATIATALQLDSEGPHRPEYLTLTGEFPVWSVQPEVKPSVAPDIDPALCRPLTTLYTQHEIAPSYASRNTSTGAMRLDEDARQRGVLIHRMLELLNTNPQQTTDIPRLLANETGLAVDDDLMQGCWLEAQAVVTDPALAHLFAADHTAWNEVPILYAAKGNLVHGVIDRVILDAQSARIIDYKTHRHANADNLAEIARPYHEQMRWYVEGAQRLWPKRTIDAVLLFTACRQTYSMDLPER